MTTSTRIRRRDAREHRERLIKAAVDLFETEGFDVPLEKIASRAGVSRPTLYRNFPDRETISEIVQKYHLERMEERVKEWADRDDAFLLAVKMIAERTLHSGGFEKVLTSRRNKRTRSEVFAKPRGQYAACRPRAYNDIIECLHPDTLPWFRCPAPER